jgi:tetratricopeptide (TPR) repeat protein
MLSQAASVEGLFRRLVAVLEVNDRRGVNEVATTLLDSEADIGKRWQTIATLLQHNGEYIRAGIAMAHYVASQGHTANARFLQAALLAQTGRLAEAWDIMQTVPPTVPDRAGHSYILGSMAINLGTTKEAQQHLNDAIAANPKLGQAMLSLAASEKMGRGNPIGDQVLAAQTVMMTAPALEVAHYQFAAGKVHFDREETDQAFAAFAKGGAIVGPMRPYNRADDKANAQACVSGFDRVFIRETASKVAIPTDRPIFVTGLPRSGTTLVEQILVSHSEVLGGEELGKLPIVERDIGGADAASLRQYLRRGTADELASLYLHLVNERFSEPGRVVDKSLNASRHLGQIASLLPQAPIVWLRRDPLDCAWSAFRTYFLRGLDWSWRLEDIAYHFKLEDALFAHWIQLLGERVLIVDYETLVAEPKSEIRRILKHCGLKEEPAVFEPHKTKRAVTTASVAQVRQPIGVQSVNNSDPYRKHLAPFIDAYFN